MNERFTRVYSLPENLYAAGSPVVIAAGALLKDNQTGKILAQLKLRNISQKGIKAAKVCIFPCDTIGNPLGDSVSYQYLDLNVARDADFGQKSAITLPNATTRAFAATVEEIIFSDNTVWTASGAAWEPLSAPTPLSSLGNPELTKQFCLEYGQNSKFLPVEQKELWFCSCGALNRTNEDRCHCCGQTLFALQTIDMDALRANADKRIAAEKAQAEKEAAAAKAKAKKNGKIAAIVIPIAVILIVGSVLLSNALKKNHAYDDAVALMDAGQYEEAIAAFEALEGYKDSAEFIASANQELQQLEEEAKREADYQEALKLMQSSDYGKQDKAYNLLSGLGDYKDAADIRSKFQYLPVIRTEKTSGLEETYSYDTLGRLVQKEYQGTVLGTTFLGQYYYNYYSDNTYMIEHFIDGVSMERNWYNSHGDIIKTTNDRGQNEETLIEYYENGMYKRREILNHNLEMPITQIIEYDEEGNYTLTASSTGNQSYGKIDSHNNPLLISNYQEHHYRYNESGQMLYKDTYINGKLNDTIEYAYDDYGNLTYIHKTNKSTGENTITEYIYTYVFIYCPDAR